MDTDYYRYCWFVKTFTRPSFLPSSFISLSFHLFLLFDPFSSSSNFQFLKMKEQQPQHSRQRSSELFWPRVVMRKWLNIAPEDSDYSADSDDEFQDEDDDDLTFFDAQDLPRLRRRNSETFRAQYINAKDLRVCVGTWNVGGKVPPDDLDIEEWININDPADIYVLGLQEIVPLNAGNIFGPEDNGPALIWENIIRETLSRIRPSVKRFKSFSDPPSPSKFKPSEDVLDIEEEVLETDSYGEEEVCPLDKETCCFHEARDKAVVGKILSDIGEIDDDEISIPGTLDGLNMQHQFSSPRKLGRLPCFRSGLREEDEEGSLFQPTRKLNKSLSGTERMGLSWPEPPLSLLGQHIVERTKSLITAESFKSSKSFRQYNSLKLNNDPRTMSDVSLLAEVDLASLVNRRRRPEYVRIVSKQMVGVFLTVWVRRGLRKHIQHLKVDSVGVGVMGYIGNKGAVSVSMSIYQTLFCFICTHLTSGERDADEHKRNADVHEIHRRTRFYPVSDLGLPKSILDHEKVIWLGDLNYRINLSYDETCKLISERNWSKLLESDQLVKQLKKGRAFDGWSEGILNFPPTYKYEPNSDKYCGEDPKAGRRTPAWCDRILSFGKGMKLMNYKRSELKLSDHRPVTATYTVEVEVFSSRKLQRALTFTDAELENEDILINKGVNSTMSRFREDLTDYGR